MKRMLRIVIVLLVAVWPLIVCAPALAAEPPAAAGAPMDQHDKAMIACWAALAIALVTAISIIGAAYAVARVGSAAIGATSEKPEMMARNLVFVALGEGLAVLGLAVAFLLMFMVLLPLVKP